MNGSVFYICTSGIYHRGFEAVNSSQLISYKRQGVIHTTYTHTTTATTMAISIGWTSDFDWRLAGGSLQQQWRVWYGGMSYVGPGVL